MLQFQGEWNPPLASWFVSTDWWTRIQSQGSGWTCGPPSSPGKAQSGTSTVLFSLWLCSQEEAPGCDIVPEVQAAGWELPASSECHSPQNLSLTCLTLLPASFKSSVTTFGVPWPVNCPSAVTHLSGATLTLFMSESRHPNQGAPVPGSRGRSAGSWQLSEISFHRGSDILPGALLSSMGRRPLLLSCFHLQEQQQLPQAIPFPFLFLFSFFLQKKNCFFFLESLPCSDCFPDARPRDEVAPGFLGPASCCRWLPGTVSDFIENVCVSFQHVHKWRGKKACCWKKVSWCVIKCMHTLKWDIRTVISNDSLASPLPLLFILAARFQSFATQSAGAVGCASVGLWRKAGSVSKAWPPTRGPCLCLQCNYWNPSNSVSKSDLSPVQTFLSAKRPCGVPCRWGASLRELTVQWRSRVSPR